MHTVFLQEDLEVPLPLPEESIEMLCHLSRMDLEAHRISANAIVEELECLPLAIEQVASYVRHVTHDFTAYLADYGRRRRELHWWIAQSNRQYSHSLATVWLVSFAVVEQEISVALKFLQLLSFLNPDNISLNFLMEGKNALETEMEKTLTDNMKFAEVLLCLERFSLIKWSRERETLSIHRLIQAVVKDKLESLDRLRWGSVVVKMCATVMRQKITNETRKLFREYQSQVVIPLVGLGDACPPEGAEIVYRIGSFMNDDGKYSDAEKLISIAIGSLSLLPEKDNARILKFRSEFGLIKGEMDQLAEAVATLQKTLDIQKATLGPKNLDTLQSMNHLAIVYRAQGLLSEAAELHKEEMAGCMRLRQKDHPSTLQSMNNLANVYRDQGLLSEAAELHKEVWTERTRLLGKDHPGTL